MSQPFEESSNSSSRSSSHQKYRTRYQSVRALLNTGIAPLKNICWGESIMNQGNLVVHNEKNDQTIASENNNNTPFDCTICTEPVLFYSVGNCNHRVCYKCSLRLRKLYKSDLCPFCKTVLDEVIITASHDFTFDSFGPAALLPFHDMLLGVHYESYEAAEAARAILELRCPGCRKYVAATWKELEEHVSTRHSHLSFCETCVTHKRVFAGEHSLYTKRTLPTHCLNGDMAIQKYIVNPDSSFHGGHPECGLCKVPFFCRDDLFNHCRKIHEECFLCQKKNIQYAYYADYNMLEKHFIAAHYACRNRECLEKKFMVFENEVELRAHQLSVHHNQRNNNNNSSPRSGGGNYQNHQKARLLANARLNETFDPGSIRLGFNNTNEENHNSSLRTEGPSKNAFVLSHTHQRPSRSHFELISTLPERLNNVPGALFIDDNNNNNNCRLAGARMRAPPGFGLLPEVQKQQQQQQQKNSTVTSNFNIKSSLAAENNNFINTKPKIISGSSSSNVSSVHAAVAIRSNRKNNEITSSSSQDGYSSALQGVSQISIASSTSLITNLNSGAQNGKIANKKGGVLLDLSAQSMATLGEFLSNSDSSIKQVRKILHKVSLGEIQANDFCAFLEKIAGPNVPARRLRIISAMVPENVPSRRKILETAAKRFKDPPNASKKSTSASGKTLLLINNMDLQRNKNSIVSSSSRNQQTSQSRTTKNSSTLADHLRDSANDGVTEIITIKGKPDKSDVNRLMNTFAKQSTNTFNNNNTTGRTNKNIISSVPFSEIIARQTSSAFTSASANARGFGGISQSSGISISRNSNFQSGESISSTNGSSSSFKKTIPIQTTHNLKPTVQRQSKHGKREKREIIMQHGGIPGAI